MSQTPAGHAINRTQGRAGVAGEGDSRIPGPSEVADESATGEGRECWERGKFGEEAQFPMCYIQGNECQSC